MNDNNPEKDRESAPHILIVEDSAIQAESLRRLLASAGYAVSVARDGAAGLAGARELPPDMIISDILMPEMDGFELCRNVKTDKRLGRIPVMLLTSLSDPQDVIRGMQCGADQFITKPYDKKRLLAAVDHLLHDRKRDEREGENRQGIHISYRGETYLIRSNPRQILNLLLSTYETAMEKNHELITTQNELKSLNDGLEEMVDNRTTALRAKNDELNAVLEQLWQAAKLATMGELASSIAHELNNPLAIISLRIESLIEAASEGDPARRKLEIIGQEVERMGKLVTNLLQFSRRSHRRISTVDIREEIENTLELIHYHLRKLDIRVVVEFAPDLPKVLADREQLRQLFLNLFTNACDAMPEGGTLTIRGSVHDGEGRIVIEIADTGIGIPPEILPKVTEPFYTTKPEGKGTGLGLAICRRVAQEHQGTLDITSEGVPGKGTHIRITLASTAPDGSLDKSDL